MSGKWIECNLPWDNYSTRPSAPDTAIYEERALRELGTNYKTIRAMVQKTISKEFYSTQAKLAHDRNITYDEARKLLLKENNKLSFIIKREDCEYKRYFSWIEKQPEDIAWINEDKEHCKKSFCGQELNTVGTLIEIDVEGEIKQLLIGNINEDGGAYDYDSKRLGSFKENSIVLRYKKVWDCRDEEDK